MSRNVTIGCAWPKSHDAYPNFLPNDNPARGRIPTCPSTLWTFSCNRYT
jgi:hypothetical protein